MNVLEQVFRAGLRRLNLRETRSVKSMMQSLLRDATKSSWRVIAGATSWARVLPDFLILGAQKAGTKSMLNYLLRHPDVLRPTVKEVHFFDGNFERGVGWYRRHFPTRALQVVLERTRPNQRIITGEATPCYLAHPLAPGRVARVVPEAQFIVLLRDPVERAYSHYRMRLEQGTETNPDFTAAVRAEQEFLRHTREQLEKEPDPLLRLKWETKRRQSFLYRGHYAHQVKRWLRFFPREQFLFLKSEDFFRDEAAGFTRAREFLRLREWHPESFPHYNYSGSRSPVPQPAREWLHRYFDRRNRDLPGLIGAEFQWSRTESVSAPGQQQDTSSLAR